MSAKEIERLAELARSVAGPLGDDRYYLSNDESRAVVRAILQAIRDPDDETWAKMYAAAWRHSYDCVEEGTVYDEYDSDPAILSPEAPQLIWQAMIDHLLQE